MPRVPRWDDGSRWDNPGLVWGPVAGPLTKQGGTGMQNLISIQITDQKLASIDAAITALEQEFDFLIDLTPEDRKSLTKMGDKSEAFARQTVTVLGQNTGNL